MAPGLSDRYRWLRISLEKLSSIAKQKSSEEYLKGRDLQDIMERNIQRAVESISDISNYLIADKGWRKAKSDVDAIKVLREQGVITDTLETGLELWIKRRNIIVHEYAIINPEEIFVSLKDILHLYEVASIFADYCETVEEN